MLIILWAQVGKTAFWNTKCVAVNKKKTTTNEMHARKEKVENIKLLAGQK